MGELRSKIESTRGGVMTAEVGAVTGTLELVTTVSDGTVEVRVRYVDAEDLYTVEGSPTKTALPEAECHGRICELLTTPGEKRGFNEDPTTLPDEIS
ncbi:hypothetical protein [Rubrobacter indicoceani]|uniref:hypothetical protein n=1 Tax=Rubrobacter indicoceani TaxID=2051957 RepID=UPI000E5A1520|nr:hypothetical protein [Rubrobacter indicoceani]